MLWQKKKIVIPTNVTGSLEVNPFIYTYHLMIKPTEPLRKIQHLFLLDTISRPPDYIILQSLNTILSDRKKC